MAEEDVNRFLSILNVGFFIVAADFILLTNLWLSMEGRDNFFTDLRALMTNENRMRRIEEKERRGLINIKQDKEGTFRKAFEGVEFYPVPRNCPDQRSDTFPFSSLLDFKLRTLLNYLDIIGRS